MSSVSNAGSVGQAQILVAKMQLDTLKQQGKDAVALIESSAAPEGAAGPPANAASGVGTNINYKA